VGIPRSPAAVLVALLPGKRNNLCVEYMGRKDKSTVSGSNWHGPTHRIKIDGREGTKEISFFANGNIWVAIGHAVVDD
jgi:hypothetical protein